MVGRPTLDNEAIFKDRNFLGHPKDLLTTCLRYLCNSFSYYGFTTALIYYLYKEAPVDLGFDKIEAAQLLPLYSVLVVICGVVGSYMADRVFGVRKALHLMNIVVPILYLILVVPGSGVIGYAVATGLLLCNNMIAGQSMNMLAVKLCQRGDTRRDSAFVHICVIANIDSAVPVTTGITALLFSYHAAFAFCAAVPVVGSTIFFLMERRVFGTIAEEPADLFPEITKRKAVLVFADIVATIAAILTYLPSNRIITIRQFANTVSPVAVFLSAIYLVHMIPSPKTKPEEKRRVLFIISIFITCCFTNLVSYQGSTVLGIYAETSVNMSFSGKEVTPAPFVTLQPILSILLGSLITGLWAELGRKQSTTPGRMGIGTLCYGISILTMVLPFQTYVPGGETSPLWPIGFYAVCTVGEAICWFAGIFAATVVAPAAFATQTLAIWSMGQSTDASLLVPAANSCREGSGSVYFLAIGVAVVAAVVIILVLQRPLAHDMSIDKKS